MENYTEAMVLRDIKAMTESISTYFPNTTIYPSLGNHDNFLSDQLPPPPLGSIWLGKVRRQIADEINMIRFISYH